MVVAEQVQDAVHAEQLEFFLCRVARLFRLDGGDLRAEHHVAEQARFETCVVALLVRAPPIPGGRSSSIGNDSTSVGPGSSIHFTCKSVMGPSSTSSTDSSARRWIRSWSSAERATEASATSSTVTPDSLTISMVT